ncbi:hypothetical protein A33Q_1232 [Indibacter alkaliphilus LW1]|uniref:Uncharacterized protein n=1 Tax=Indibacter alkaliphilus (strain CCUG 57479 / KCTC 22604 / LW1) TaxID=1189612 RepID=S2E8H8_INDAL|nr:hypothetical protein [Indibacter alkaliphilus]EOZ98578.1 hypothetical protein A33Q_1232 [Indibacter alkaliphilus LW1]
MQIPSLAEIKRELKLLNENELIDVVLDLAKYSRENKAYLFFRLFEKENPRIYVDMVKDDLDLNFMNANTRNYHVAKKSAQTIRRKLNKNLKLTKDKTAQIELIIHFCKQMKAYGYLQYGHPVIENLFKVQIGKAEKLISGLHEDLQYDFQLMLEDLS